MRFQFKPEREDSFGRRKLDVGFRYESCNQEKVRKYRSDADFLYKYRSRNGRRFRVCIERCDGDSEAIFLSRRGANILVIVIEENDNVCC